MKIEKINTTTKIKSIERIKKIEKIVIVGKKHRHNKRR